jgi:hypothetical protein
MRLCFLAFVLFCSGPELFAEGEMTIEGEKKVEGTAVLVANKAPEQGEISTPEVAERSSSSPAFLAKGARRMRHPAGLFDEYKDVTIDEDPKTLDLITAERTV